MIYHSIESIQGGQLETAETVISQKFLLKGTPDKDYLYNKTSSTIRPLYDSEKAM